MATLQHSFNYEGNALHAPIRLIGLQFEIPAFEFIRSAEDRRQLIGRIDVGSEWLKLVQELKLDNYNLVVPDHLLVGTGDESVLNFWRYLFQAGSANNDNAFVDSLSFESVLKITDDAGNIFGQHSRGIIFSLATSSNKFKKLVTAETALSTGLSVNTSATLKLWQEVIAFVKENVILINKDVFNHVAEQFKIIAPKHNDYALLHIISHLTDITSGKPEFKISLPEFRKYIKGQFLIDDNETINSIINLVGDKYSSLFDFPISVPEIKSSWVEGTIKIKTSDNSTVTIHDFNYYDLTVDYSIGTPDQNTISINNHFTWDTKTNNDIVDNTLHFLFTPFITNFINSLISIAVKGHDGTFLWGQEFGVDNKELQNLKIEVPLRKPEILGETEDTPVPGTNKKLYGKVLELSAKCKMKGLTVLIQAKKEGDNHWRIVGAATTDGSGNFSMAYPFGVYKSAQAIVSLTPNSPAEIAIHGDTAHLSINQTIADDFLYLLIQDIDCLPKPEEDECDCHDPRKPFRLPGYEELIGSDEYTQDIGGSCVNLSTPNRTLNEYAHTAVVRTSDPDVANYILTKEMISREKNNDTITFKLTGGYTKIVRKEVDLGNPIKWQDAPDSHENLSIYQAVEVATGHILHYKVVIKADGYSMGELIYSLPLAPGQKKEIVVFDQTHKLRGTETQQVSQGESLGASLVNDISITDTLSGSINESTRGSSSATTRGASGGFGLGGIFDGIGISLGVSGGVANSSSNASQNSSRNVAESFAEKLRNSITQNAQSYRELNASVITTVEEGQNYGVTSEVVSNHNHCHSLTMMYFEVLRHYAIYQELSSVEECLFVPLLMTNFSTENIYKWRDVLAGNLLPVPSETYLQPFNIVKGGRQHPFIKAFDANERIKTNYVNVDFPDGAYDDEIINFITGELFIQANLPRPKSRYDRIKSWPVIKKEQGSSWSWTGAVAGTILAGPLGGIVGGFLNADGSIKLEVQAIIDDYIEIDDNYASVPPAQSIRVRNFANNFFEDDIIDKRQWTAYAVLLGYNDVSKMLDHYFKGRLISEWDSIYYNDIAPVVFEKIISRISLGSFSSLDFSTVNKYKGGNVLMSINIRGNGSNKKRKEITELKIEFNNNLLGLSTDLATLNIRNLNIRYSTPHYNGLLFSGFVNDDLVDGSTLQTPENANEKRNPRKEDRHIVNKLIEHLNSNLEYYNKLLWSNLDVDRRYMLLDGFSIQTYDDFGQPSAFRSLASVVKNELVGIAGNSLVMPVAPGYKIDRSYIIAQSVEGAVEQVSLFDHYKPLTPAPPYRISIPSKGVFAEAVQGACDACEKVKENTSQDWTKFTTDEPTAINPITTPVPTVTDWRAAFKDFASPMVNIQNAPAAPAPGAGLAGLSELLGKSDVFKDVTGLDANQKNVLQTYLSNQENARAFAEMAKEMTMQAHNTEHADSIADAIRNSPELSKEEKAQLLKSHFQQQIDGGSTQNKKDKTTAKFEDSIKAVDTFQKTGVLSEEAANKAKEKISENLTDGSEGVIDLSDAANKNQQNIKTQNPDGSLVDIVSSIFSGGGSPAPSKASTELFSRPGFTSDRTDFVEPILGVLKLLKDEISTQSPWKLSKNEVFNRIESLIIDPILINQGLLRVCGPAVFFRLLIERDPMAFLQYATILYYSGAGKIGSNLITPGTDIVNNNYADIDFKGVPCPQADWMCMGALRDDTNWFFDFEGNPSDNGGTTSGELTDWLRKSNMYKTVENNTNKVLNDDLSDAMELNKYFMTDVVNHDIIMNIHTKMFKDVATLFPGKTLTAKEREFFNNFFLDSFGPNHYILLTSNIRVINNKVDFSYWTWGENYHTVVDKEHFVNNYYGHIHASTK